MITTYDLYIGIVPARIDVNTHYHLVILVFNPNEIYNQLEVIDYLTIKTNTNQIPFNELTIGSNTIKDTYVAKIHICINTIDYLKELYSKLDDLRLTYNKQNLDKIK